MKHLYNFCEDDDTNNTIACISLPSWHGPWESAKSLLSTPTVLKSINATLKISADKTFLEAVKTGYTTDNWCKTLPSTALSLPGLVLLDGLWYVGECLVIPHTRNLHETLFMLTHDVLEHYSFDKTYGSLRTAYYWPNM